MIRIRRVESGLPLTRSYELQFAPDADATPTETVTVRRGLAVRRLERELGTGDAWSFIIAADGAWEKGDKAGRSNTSLPEQCDPESAMSARSVSFQDAIRCLEDAWDFPEGVFFRLRQGDYDPEGIDEIVKFLRSLAVDDDVLLPRRFVSLTWWIPTSWNGKKNA
jgi:hypothetical protein